MEVNQPYFVHPFTCLISGPSGSGKSTLLQQMLNFPQRVFQVIPSQVVIVYSRTQQLYQDIIKSSKIPVQLVHGLSADLRPKKNALLIFDDLMEKQNLVLISEWFTKNSHHYQISVLYLIQNLFLQSPHHRTISLNAHYIIIFSNPRDKTVITHLSSQFSPGNLKYVIDAYSQSTKSPFGYLVFNFTQTCPEELRLRSSIYGDAGVFVDIKEAIPTDLNSIER